MRTATQFWIGVAKLLINFFSLAATLIACWFAIGQKLFANSDANHLVLYTHKASMEYWSTDGSRPDPWCTNF